MNECTYEWIPNESVLLFKNKKNNIMPRTINEIELSLLSNYILVKEFESYSKILHDESSKYPLNISAIRIIIPIK